MNTNDFAAQPCWTIMRLANARAVINYIDHDGKNRTHSLEPRGHFICVLAADSIKNLTVHTTCVNKRRAVPLIGMITVAAPDGTLTHIEENTVWTQ